jgi:transcriptional regulator with XRE-family HTH domain
MRRENKSEGFDFVMIGERLRAFRMAADLRTEDVAARLEISRAAVYKLERGEIVKIDTLERLSALLGLEVEYHAAAVSYFERMRQLESRSSRILAHFDPISYLLTSDDYDRYLRLMLNESIPESLAGKSWKATVDTVLTILAERKMAFARLRPNVESLIGLSQLEQFLHHGLVGRLGLPPGEQLGRKLAARREVMNIVELLRGDPLGIRIGIVSDSMSNQTFQIFEDVEHVRVAVSPFRLGELPNIRSGIATITSAPDAVAMYRELIEHLWKGAAKGEEGARLLEALLARC